MFDSAHRRRGQSEQHLLVGHEIGRRDDELMRAPSGSARQSRTASHRSGRRPGPEHLGDDVAGPGRCGVGQESTDVIAAVAHPVGDEEILALAQTGPSHRLMMSTHGAYRGLMRNSGSAQFWLPHQAIRCRRSWLAMIAQVDPPTGYRHQGIADRKRDPNFDSAFAQLAPVPRADQRREPSASASTRTSVTRALRPGSAHP